MAEKIGNPEQNIINAVSWLFFLNPGVILKEIMKEGEKSLFLSL